MTEKKLQLAVSEEEIKAAIVAKANELKDFYTNEKLFIVSELSGVFVFLADFIRELPIDVSIKFISFDKNDDNNQQMTLDLEDKTTLSGSNVLIIADVYRKGNHLQRVYDVVKNLDPKDVKILSLVNRNSTEKNLSIQVQSLFNLEDKKIVGYGLPDHESYRGLKSLYYIEEE